MTKPEKILTQLFISILGISIILIGLKNDSQTTEIGFINNRISLLESNHVQLVESLSKWNKNDQKFDKELIENINKVNLIQDTKIENLVQFDNLVITQLQTISKISRSFLGAVSTNYP